MDYCGVQVIMTEVWVKFDKGRKLNEQEDTVYTIIKTPELKLYKVVDRFARINILVHARDH